VDLRVGAQQNWLQALVAKWRLHVREAESKLPRLAELASGKRWSLETHREWGAPADVVEEMQRYCEEGESQVAVNRNTTYTDLFGYLSFVERCSDPLAAAICIAAGQPYSLE
jgi:hypothetical protein